LKLVFLHKSTLEINHFLEACFSSQIYMGCIGEIQPLHENCDLPTYNYI